MMLIGLLALIAGMLAGYISLRAVGWLCVLLLGVVVCQGGTVSYTLIGSGGSVQLSQYEAADCSGTANTHSASPAFAGTYEMTTADSPWVGSYKWYVNDGGWKNSGCLPGPPQSMTYDFGTHSFSSNSTTNYVFQGCITNTSGYPRRLRLHVQPLGQQGSTLSSAGLILPGEGWCWGPITNAVPTQITPEVDIYDGEGNFVQTVTGAPWWAQTNINGGSVTPVVVSTGSGGPNSTGDYATGNPTNSTAGAYGSTNNLTGAQYVAGMTNLMNVIYQGFNAVGRGLGFMGTNGGAGTGTNLDYVGWLRAISNNTAITTNFLGGAERFSASNNLWSYSNSAAGNSFSISNSLAEMRALGGDGQMIEGTNIASVADVDLSLWEYHRPLTIADTGYGSGGGAGAAKAGLGWINFNPMLTKAGAALGPWFKLLGTFLLMVYAIKYVYGLVESAMLHITLVPGSGPFKGTFSFLGVGLSMGTTLAALLSIPLVVGAAIMWLFPLGMLSIVANPVSTAGLSVAGTWAMPFLKLGLWLFLECFPFVYAVQVALYLFALRMSVHSLVVWWSNVVRAVAN